MNKMGGVIGLIDFVPRLLEGDVKLVGEGSKLIGDLKFLTGEGSNPAGDLKFRPGNRSISVGGVKCRSSIAPSPSAVSNAGREWPEPNWWRKISDRPKCKTTGVVSNPPDVLDWQL
ncbi:hypothetical protein [Longitalea arenae]|uniref:hypothetical protein n=1 Tax=Longitalea arenae TaxID=2812558 RepID=UPI0019685312|nr:hypothetical protein [Longitalea arenae]